jgi:hypothetical protein
MISGAEAGRIGRALESVAGWTSEMVVVLNEDVRDGTEDITRGRGAHAFREPWKGHIAQKNSAAAKATQPWILGLDADEVVSPELREEILRLFARPGGAEPFAAYSFPRCTLFCGRWIRHGDWYPDRKTRLWKKGAAEWSGVDPHDKLLVRGNIGQLRGDLLHEHGKGVDEMIAKIPRYSDDFARHAKQTGRGASWFDLAVRPAWRFARSYLFRLGFLDGWQGSYIAWMTAFYTATRYAKIRTATAQETSLDRAP